VWVGVGGLDRGRGNSTPLSTPEQHAGTCVEERPVVVVVGEEL